MNLSKGRSPFALIAVLLLLLSPLAQAQGYGYGTGNLQLEAPPASNEDAAEEAPQQAPASEQEQGAAQEQAPTDDEPGEFDAVRITVRVTGGSGQPSQAPVRLHTVVRPHDVLDTRTGQPNPDGSTHFRLRPMPGADVIAELQGERRSFSDPLAIDVAGDYEIVIHLPETTNDRSVVHADSVHTVLDLWEGYITVTQAWNLNVRGDKSFASTRSEDGRPDVASLIMINLPEGAQGIHVIRPEGAGRVNGTLASIATQIDPRRPGESRGADILIQYSMPSGNAAAMEWTQPVPMDVGSFNVVVPLSSTHVRHPALDVELHLPDCSDPSEVCLEFTQDNADLPLDRNLPVIVARGPARSGQRVTMSTSGWPSRSLWDHKAAIFLTLFALGLVVWLVGKERNAPQKDPRERQHAVLEMQRESLFEAAGELERQLQDGLILESDHALQSERIRQQLAVVYRKLRELESTGSATGSG